MKSSPAILLCLMLASCSTSSPPGAKGVLPTVIILPPLPAAASNRAAMVAPGRPVVAPPESFTLTAAPTYPALEIQGTTNFVTWTSTGFTTNGELVISNLAAYRHFRARVAAAAVSASWTASPSDSVTGYTLVLLSSATNVIATLEAGLTNAATMVVRNPDRCLIMAVEAHDDAGDYSGFSNFARYKPTWPVLKLSR